MNQPAEHVNPNPRAVTPLRPRVEAVAPRDLIPDVPGRFEPNAIFDKYVIVRYTALRPPTSTILDASGHGRGARDNEPMLVITRASRVDDLKKNGKGTALYPSEMQEMVRLVNIRISVEDGLPPEKKTYKHLRPLKRVAFRHGKQTTFAVGHKERDKRGFTLAEAHDIVDMMNFVLGYFTLNRRGNVQLTL